MVKILREADQSPVAEVAKKHGISDVTIYAWRKRFGQLEAVDVKRLRQLEQENANELLPAETAARIRERDERAVIECAVAHDAGTTDGVPGETMPSERLICR